MADGLDFDFSEIDELLVDMATVPENAGANILAAVKITSLKIKKDWQEPLKGSALLPALPYAINFDVTTSSGIRESAVESEIGFDLSKNQGPLGGVSEFGTPTNTGRGFGLAALEKNAADFQYGIELAIDQAQKKAGL